MSPSKRKRFSAFEDFPANDTVTSAPQSEKLSPPGQVASQPAAGIQRIESLKPSQMIPDRFQPRRLLPGPVRQAFFSGQMDCYQAAAEWISLSRQDTAYHAEVERLLAMGGSFDEHGQIKPITGAWVEATDGGYIFQIETGERRFWAACLTAVSQQLEEEPMLRIEVVEKPTRQRQVLENRHAEQPSAVGQACEIASLILAELDIQPDSTLTDEYEFFRRARSQRMPAGLWDRITPIMQLTRPRMVQLLNILQLPTPLLDLANRYRLPERVLREVLGYPQNQWERLLRVSIQSNLTSDDVAEYGERIAGESLKPTRSKPAAPPKLSKTAIGGLRRFANALAELDEISQMQALDEVADELVATHQAQGLMNLLDELARSLQTRLTRQ